MNKKNSALTVILILATLVLGGLSFYIGMQLNQPSEEIAQKETKPENVEYKKNIQLNQVSPTVVVSTGIKYTASPTAVLTKNSTASGNIGKLTPTKTLLSTNSSSSASTASKSNSETMITVTPTGINVVTTPIVTSTLAKTLLTGTTTPFKSTTSATVRPTVNSLPSAGMFNTTLIIFAAAISMIFFSFLL